MAVAYQLIADIKPYLILSFAFCLVDKYRDQVFSVIDLFGRKVWLVLLLLIALQFLATSFFKSLFPFSYIGYDESGLFPSRALGFFENSSYLASFSAFYATFYFTCFLAKISARQSHQDLLLFVAYFCMLVFAIQRQELAALFIVLLFSFIFFKNQAWSTRLIIAVAGLVLGGELAQMPIQAFEGWVFVGNSGLLCSIAPGLATRRPHDTLAPGGRGGM